MFDIKSNGTQMNFSISSRMEMIDRVLPVILDFIEEFGELGSTEYVPLVIRELLCNAIEHGNGNDPVKVVSGTIEKIEKCRYKITVTDEGEGCTLDDISYSSSPDPVNGRSMGFSIINNFCDEILFAEGMSSITVYMGLNIQTEITITNTKDGTILIPSGDISATISEKFRDVLINWFDSSSEQCTLDFSNVESIDSISLGILINFHRMLNSSDDTRELIITNSSEAVLNVFQLTQIHKMFTITDRL